MYLLGLDIGSSSVKANLVDAQSGHCVGEDFLPKQEMAIVAPCHGWAEQDPELWWSTTKALISKVTREAGVNPKEIGAIGISYQMHGLVVVDKSLNVLRPSVIWCDSRAVDIGEKAFQTLGPDRCLSSLLNSPGNFTASKLRWIRENEPDLYAKIHKFMLPGDFIALKFTGEARTTASGLSEGIFWNFKENRLADFLLNYYDIDPALIPDLCPTFGPQGNVMASVAKEMGLTPGIPVTYRAGDQPNNAFSLNVLKPGEIAATAGTSGVVYGVGDQVAYDPKSRVNTFLHVNHEADAPRYGTLMCINGAGSLNSWLRTQIMQGAATSYSEMNRLAESVPIGADNLVILPFGNGSERILENKTVCAHIDGLRFTRHTRAHVLRAAQEGVAFAFKYGIDLMKEMGVQSSVIRAGKANMFLNKVFRETLSGITGARIELYNTNGGLGAALGAGYGAGVYSDLESAFKHLNCVEAIQPSEWQESAYAEAYHRWSTALDLALEAIPAPVASKTF